MSVPMPEVSGTEPVADATTGPEITAGESTGGEPTGGDSGGMNPAWNDLLERIPSALHPAITPQLRAWDQGVQQKLTQVQSQYEPYKPFLETSPDQLNAAMELYRLADSNPQLLYKQMGEYFGFGGGQGQEEVTQPGSGEGELDLSELGDLAQHPKFQELIQNQEAMAALLVQEHQQKEQAALSNQIDSELEAIKTTYPGLSTEDDQAMVLQTAMTRQISIPDAAKIVAEYKGTAAAQAQVPAPSILSANGQIPAAPPIDPTKLDNKATRSLVADLIRAQQGQG